MKNILLAFYGDDFTGSTDALEFISKAGANAILFMEPPTPSRLKDFPGINVYGVAGKTRSLPAAEISEILEKDFLSIAETHPDHFHYKVCSTFDSSPEIGNIGIAIDIGSKLFPNRFIPIPGGMPLLGRCCVFGNLFARMGTTAHSSYYRLDRHPSMSKHPITPATESDLRVHLGAQTEKTFGLINVTELNSNIDDFQPNTEVVIIDVLEEGHLEIIGGWLDRLTTAGLPFFSIGSSAVEYALGKCWNRTGKLKQSSANNNVPAPSTVLVLSGSRSPVTHEQVRYAIAHGFDEVLLETANGFSSLKETCEKVNAALVAKKLVIVHTGEDVIEDISAATLGEALGTIANYAIENKLVERIIVAGGDTSSYAARTMKIEAVSILASIVPGAPLCTAISSNQNVDGMQVNFKGGQVGSPEYFELMVRGIS